MTPMSGAGLLTAQEAAARIGVNERTIRRAIASGALAAHKRGGAFAITTADIDCWRESRVPAANHAPSGEAGTHHPGGAPEPPQSPRGTGTLPRPLTSFISREREVTAAVSMLRREDVRLLTLVGPGGVGKTRLAIRIAEELAGDHDGPWFVPLAGVTDPERVVDSIVTALGVPHAYGQSTRSALHGYLADRSGLVVFDNLEQVIDAAPDIADLLAACPRITALVTSRTLLRLTGEHAFPVPPLDVPTAGEAFVLDALDRSAAMRLFVERATALMPTFTLTAETAPMVADICRLVDGLPLALELAAARITAMPLDVLRDRLRQQLAVLTTGTRDGPRRHRTMRDAISWSYDLLTPREQEVLRSISVFTGGFTESAAIDVATTGEGAGIAGHSEPMIDTIGSLIDKSLVRHANRDNQRHRFEMLETIRAFGLEQAAAAGELRDIQNRHANWLIAYVRQLLDGWRHIPDITAENQWKLAAIDVEQDNARAALGWLHGIGDRHRMLVLAVTMQSFWELCVTHDEAIAWLDQGLALTTDVPLDTLRMAHMTVGRKRRRQGQFDHACSHYQSALRLAEQEHYPLAIAQAIYALGCVATNLEDTDQAEERLTEALQRFTDLGDHTGICGSHYFLGVVYLRSNQPTKSLAALEQALATRRLPGVFFNESVILNAYGMACCANSLIDRAHKAKEESLALWRRGEGASQEVLAEWLGLAAVVAFRRDHHAHATWLLGAGDALSTTLGVPLMLGTANQRAWLHQMLIEQLGQERFDAELAAGARTSPEVAAAANVTFDAAQTRPNPDPEDAQAVDQVLTPREQEVLNLLAAGMRDRAIADQLFLSVRTVQGHVARITHKLGATSRTSAMAIAFSRGLVTPTESIPD